MLRQTLITLCLACSLVACNRDVSRPSPVNGHAPAAPSPQPRALEIVWTAAGFSAPEGVAQASDGSFFISNVGGDPSAKDGNGYITKIGADGAVQVIRWADTLDAPKGMVVHDGLLYVADIDRVVMFDATSGALAGEIAVNGAQFLNDMTVFRGEVLVSDSGTGTIRRITSAGAELFGASADWAGINGLLADGDRLLISTMTEGHLIELRSADDEGIIATGMTNADGIGLVPGGGYLVSSWPGKIHFVDDAGVVSTLVDTEGEGILQNDLTVIGDLVIVPNMLPGTVTAWRITGG